ncbi:AlpA family phage regulatory protein [Pseudoalteromonas sp. CO342X]|uniref:helix-turn-helix transcriptional regulator n=1 Tax=Pseudoalteromonas sp. CO342X TaxID=1777270 RepID=UPI001023E11B|nr:AlpA family phage regulatory protein [Pseudoalteromonas sp. CO342X]RZG14374.1 AlpA family phage regulatory protein [Pseudoalteromonas sp. CO342X]
MAHPFTPQICDMADSMGICLYQRFSQAEAAFFLHCTIEALTKLQKQHKIEYIQVDEEITEFFGFQLLEYLAQQIQPSNEPPQLNTPDKIICAKEVQRLTDLSRTTIWRLERAGKFPARVPLTGSRIGWRYNDIQEWIKHC